MWLNGSWLNGGGLGQGIVISGANGSGQLLKTSTTLPAVSRVDCLKFVSALESSSAAVAGTQPSVLTAKSTRTLLTFCERHYGIISGPRTLRQHYFQSSLKTYQMRVACACGLPAAADNYPGLRRATISSATRSRNSLPADSLRMYTHASHPTQCKMVAKSGLSKRALVQSWLPAYRLCITLTTAIRDTAQGRCASSVVFTLPLVLMVKMPAPTVSCTRSCVHVCLLSH